MNTILLFIFLNVLTMFNVNSLRFTQKKRFLFKKSYDNNSKIITYINNENNENNENENKINLKDENNDNKKEEPTEYYIPKWVYKKVFKYNKKKHIFKHLDK